MKKYVAWMDKRSKIVKVIFSIPLLNFLWVIYRINKSGSEKNTLGVVLGILLFFFFWALWIVDIITLVLSNRVIWI